MHFIRDICARYFATKTSKRLSLHKDYLMLVDTFQSAQIREICERPLFFLTDGTDVHRFF